MNSFKKVKLGDLGTVYSGGTPSTKMADYWDGNVPWVTPKDLSDYREMFISKGSRNLSEAGLNNSSAKLIPAGSVIMSSRAPIGYVAIAANNLTTNQGMKSIKPDESKVDSKYLYYWIKSHIPYIVGKASGSTFKEISGGTFKNLEIDIPPLDEQKTLSGVLSNIDNKIGRNTRTNDNLHYILYSPVSIRQMII